jgi:phosphate:Na+ symporter
MELLILTPIHFHTISIGFLCGFGLFLYGISIMSESLKIIAGNRIETAINKLTSNPFKGLLVGAFLTGILQSSSGTIAITIGFVRSGLMTLPQAMGVIIGANIGTTITAFLIGLKINAFSPVFISLGAILIFFFHNSKTNNIGKVFLGFGLLFYGMDLMGSQLKLLAEIPKFKHLMIKFSHQPLLGVLTGTLLTAIVQSSSVTIGILQSLYGNHLITLKGALPILIGNNIGTTITGVIAGIGGSVETKRTSLFQVCFNLFGALVFLIILHPFIYLINHLHNKLHTSDEMTIALSHIMFNLITALFIIFFVNRLAKLLRLIIKEVN